MKALGIISIIIFICSSCAKDLASANVVTSGETVEFKELLLLINLKSSDSTNLVTTQIDSIKISVNNKPWSISASDPLDTTKIDAFVQNGNLVTYTDLQYLIRAEKQIDSTNLNTAGGIANYLVNLYELKAGEYACLVESIYFKSSSGVQYTLHPMKYLIFSVEENATSAFVGEFTINTY